jgi:hypothetical protein
MATFITTAERTSDSKTKDNIKKNQQSYSLFSYSKNNIMLDVTKEKEGYHCELPSLLEDIVDRKPT